MSLVNDQSPPTCRSRITNGSKLLAGLDGRSQSARRFRDLIQLTSDMAGARKAPEMLNSLANSGLSATQVALILQAAALTIQSEMMQAALLRGESVEPGALVKTTRAAASALKQLGLAHEAAAAPSRLTRMMDGAA